MPANPQWFFLIRCRRILTAVMDCYAPCWQVFRAPCWRGGLDGWLQDVNGSKGCLACLLLCCVSRSASAHTTFSPGPTRVKGRGVGKERHAYTLQGRGSTQAWGTSGSARLAGCSG
ncbi:hypothetical protein V8C86DRAFT_2831888 [Haematococcus lacustris]